MHTWKSVFVVWRAAHTFYIACQETLIVIIYSLFIKVLRHVRKRFLKFFSKVLWVYLVMNVIFLTCLQQHSPHFQIPLTLVCQGAHSPGLSLSCVAWWYHWQILRWSVICRSGHLGSGRSAEHLVWECSSCTYFTQRTKGACMQLTSFLTPYRQPASLAVRTPKLTLLRALCDRSCLFDSCRTLMLLFVETSEVIIHKESVCDCKGGWSLPLCRPGYMFTSKQKRNELEHWISNCLGWGGSSLSRALLDAVLVSPRLLCYKKESRWTSCTSGTGLFSPLFLSSMHLRLGPVNVIFLLAC